MGTAKICKNWGWFMTFHDIVFTTLAHLKLGDLRLPGFSRKHRAIPEGARPPGDDPLDFPMVFTGCRHERSMKYP